MINIYSSGWKYETTLANVPQFTAEKARIGGDMTLTMELTEADVSDLSEIFDTHLGSCARVQVGDFRFSGFISDMEYARSSGRFGRKEIRTLGGNESDVSNGKPAYFNAIRVAYKNGALTTWATSEEITTHGRRELTITDDTLTAAAAMQWRDYLLSIYGTARVWHAGASKIEEPTLWLTLSGELSKLSWIEIETGDGQERSVSDVIRRIVDTNTHLSTGHIASQATLVNDDLGSDGWAAIKQLAAQTNSELTPYELYATRGKTYFIPLTNSVDFFMSDAGLSNTAHGSEIADDQIDTGVWRNLTQPRRTANGFFLETRDFLQNVVRYRYDGDAITASLGDDDNFFIMSSKQFN